MLFIINFFINFFLLEITAKLTKKSPKLFRIIISSAIGGAYSLIILADELPNYILILSKILVAGIMLLVAFSYHRVTGFLLTLLIFVFSGFLLLGVIVGIYFVTKSDLIAINNSTVYFDISARMLLASAFFAYLISCLVVRLHNKQLSKKEVYSIEITNNGETVNLYGFVDTGNKLREPFSNSPVIVVQRDKVEAIIGSSQLRFIPASTVGGDALLTAFKPDKVVIKASNKSEVIENAYIALSNDVNAKGFSAVINPEILTV